MYKLNFFVPVKEKERVKHALFEIGVGRYKNYEYCSFESLGRGQFRPLKHAEPFIGEVGKLERVEEYKVEMLCHEKLIEKAVETLKSVHPYEEVAYEVLKLESF